jgi:hypothetical protein
VGLWAGLNRCEKSRPHRDFFKFVCSDVRRSYNDILHTYLLVSIVQLYIDIWIRSFGTVCGLRSSVVGFIMSECVHSSHWRNIGRCGSFLQAVLVIRVSLLRWSVMCAVATMPLCFYCVAIHILSFFLITLCM